MMKPEKFTPNSKRQQKTFPGQHGRVQRLAASERLFRSLSSSLFMRLDDKMMPHVCWRGLARLAREDHPPKFALLANE